MNAAHILRPADIRRRFDRAAAGFDAADFVHRETAGGLFARLLPVAIDASLVVDLGCATGSATRQLAKRFRGARVLGIDLSRAMLERCRERRGWFSKTTVLQADAAALPLPDHSVDVVFANQLLPWVSDPAAVAAEVARVLRKDGLFAFATLGPDSLLEIRNAWHNIDEHEHVNRFLDMHDVGDAMVRSGLRDPVLDVDRLTVTYEDVAALLRDLTAAGARNALAGRRRGLSGKQGFRRFKAALESAAVGGRISLDLELVYGHCWGSGTHAGGAQVRIDANAIPRRRR